MVHQITKLSLFTCILVLGLNACTEDSTIVANPNPLSSVCDSTNHTYYRVISKIIQNNCNDAACHGSGARDFTTYTGIKPYALNGTLMGSIKHQAGFKPMPSATEFLSNCDIKKIQMWIDEGAPNN